MPYKNAYILTGGIATGKSTVCSLLKISGFSIIDADIVAKEELENSKEELKKAFGSSIFTDGVIERKKLAQIIFDSDEQREKLNSILHPKIRASISKQAEILDKKGVPFILDIPLFFETQGYAGKMNVVVYTPREIQLQRLCQREGLEKSQALKRIQAQMDIEEKKRRADWVIDNSKDLKHLQQEVEKFVDFIRGNYAGIKI
jgi:dephospho-CoA kinase